MTHQQTHQPRVVELVWVAPHCSNNLYRVYCVASSSPLTRSPNTVMDTCALHVCPHWNASRVAFATRTKATQNSAQNSSNPKSLHSEKTLLYDAKPATRARPATSISTTNMIYNWINLSAKGAIYLHLAQSVGSCSLGTCTILLNNAKARLWIASCDVQSV